MRGALWPGGNGDPPRDAVESRTSLLRHARELALREFRDRHPTYVEFCGFGRKLDAELAAKGAQSFVACWEYDFDFDAGLPGRLCASVFAVLRDVLAPMTG